MKSKAGKILIIEDDEEMCEEFAEILRDENYQVDIAYDGISGEKRLHRKKYDLVVLDLKIPGVNGFELIKEIKTNLKRQLKVLVLSGRAFVKSEIYDNHEEDRILSLADGLVTKSIEIEEILNKVRKLVRN